MTIAEVLHTMVDHIEQLSSRVLSGASPAAELHAAIDEHYGANAPDAPPEATAEA